MAGSANNPKRKFNILDFLLILLIITTVAITIVSVIRSNPNKISGGDKDITYTIRCEMIDGSLTDNIAVGDNIYDDVTNQLLGTVTKVETEVVKAVDLSSSGLLKPLVDTNKVNITLTVSAKVWDRDGIYSIDNYRIAAGKQISFHSENISVTGSCLLITDTENGEQSNEQQ